MGRNVSSKIDREEERRGFEDLLDIMMSINDKDQMRSFINDILTDREVSDVTQRYLLMDDLSKGISQREIATKRSMSLCKITRGSKILKKKDGFMKKYFTEKYDDFTHI
ncbi:MAG: transcriptional regulator [Spirochaetales bacterium]|nr:transcriptional regulator [Candidatus Physcosoma equi]